ncbi:MAG: hypothetical protein QXO84_03590 [Candidatus Aenigmatarchaeota archaeon]
MSENQKFYDQKIKSYNENICDALTPTNSAYVNLANYKPQLFFYNSSNIFTMNFLIFISLILFSLPISTSTTIYNITLANQKIFVNVTFDINSEQAFDVWRVTWEIPHKYDILSIKDEIGYVSFDSKEGYVYFETNPLRSKRRVINIQYFINDAISEEYGQLKKVRLYLSGFEGEKTIINVYLPKIISGDASFGFSEYFDDNFAQFVGFGAADILLYYSFSGREYENYVVFGPAEFKVADRMFSLVTNITGVKKPYKRFPVVVIDDNLFESKIQPWGTASHLRGGLILMKKSVANGPYNASILLHETTHGINAKVLKWNKANSTWFEEGTASFVEYLANQMLGLQQSELFGKDKTVKKDGEKIIFKSKGRAEELWDYYKHGNDFMYYWTPENGELRDFGYAFSELVIRYAVKKNGIGKLKETYLELSKINKTVSDSIEATNILLSSLDTNFMPCYSVDRLTFEKCLQEINEQKFTFSDATAIQVTNTEIVNETIEIKQAPKIIDKNVSLMSFLNNIIENILRIFKR